MSAGIRRALPAVRSLNVTDADVEVSALGDAMASATFTREIVMEGTGATVRQLGAVSWLWPKGRWSVADRSRSHLAPAGTCEVGREVVQHRHGAVGAMAGRRGRKLSSDAAADSCFRVLKIFAMRRASRVTVAPTSSEQDASAPPARCERRRCWPERRLGRQRRRP